MRLPHHYYHISLWAFWGDTSSMFSWARLASQSLEKGQMKWWSVTGWKARTAKLLDVPSELACGVFKRSASFDLTLFSSSNKTGAKEFWNAWRADNLDFQFALCNLLHKILQRGVSKVLSTARVGGEVYSCGNGSHRLKYIQRPLISNHACHTDRAPFWCALQGVQQSCCADKLQNLHTFAKDET